MRHPKQNSKARAASIDLGLAIAGATLPKGQTRDQVELAAYADCSRQLIHSTEKRAIKKIKLALSEMGII